jgi:hypothetical protein
MVLFAREPFVAHAVTVPGSESQVASRSLTWLHNTAACYTRCPTAYPGAANVQCTGLTAPYPLALPVRPKDTEERRAVRAAPRNRRSTAGRLFETVCSGTLASKD